MSAISVTGLKKSFGDFEALKSLNLEIPRGQFLTLLGPSGSGKTTALRCMAGLEHPTAGRICLDANVVSAPEEGILVPPERRGVGFVFQNYALWPHMTVRGNVEYPLRLQKLEKRARLSRVDELLDTVGLGGFGAHRASDLSGGQQQRVALARALANNSPFMLYDEPLSNLDAQLRVRTRVAIRRLHDELGTTTVYVTHDQDEAFSMSDRVVVMNHGSIEQDGHPEEIYERPANAFIAKFVGFDNVIEHAKVVSIDAAGATTVELPKNLGTCIAAHGGFGVGESVTVAFRARDLLFADAALNQSDEAGKAVVMGVSFASGLWSIVFEMGDHTLECRIGSEAGRPTLRVGDVVPIHPRPGRPLLLPQTNGP